MHCHEGNAIQTGSYVGYFFPYITIGCRKTQKCIQEITKKSHLKFCHYVMPSPGGVIEKFYTCAQVHSF